MMSTSPARRAGESYGGITDHPENDPINVRLVAPVIVESIENDSLSRFPFHELEGSRAGGE